MSFEDTRWDIEQTVIEPLRDFRQKVAPLNQLHNDCVNQFATIVGNLLTGSDGNTAFQGQGSMAMADVVGQFLDGEETLCGSGNDLMGRLLDAATIGEKRAQELEQRLNEIAIEQDHSGEMLSGAALAVDGGAVAQGGVDVPWDIVALGLTGIAALEAATRNLDAIKVQDAESARSLEIAMWENEMESGPNTEPLNRLPPDPKGPSGDFSGFLKMMGITIGAAGVVLAAGAIIVNLSPAQEDLAQRLHSDYGSSGLSLDDIREIIADNPNLTEDQLRQLLSKYAQVVKAYPNLVSSNGSLQVFIAFVALSSYDPAHKGNYPARTPVIDKDLSKRIEEAETLLGAAEAGDLPWPLAPSTDAAYEAIDANGQKWDVKAWRSGLRPPFDANTALNTIKKEVNKGENILINDQYISTADRLALDRAIKSAGLEGNVVWWPDQP
jgi:hypothetical protein